MKTSSGYSVSKKLDYLSVTVEKTPARIVGEKTRELDVVPYRNYDKGYTTENGALVMWSTKHSNVGVHIVMTGNALSIMRGEGHSDKDIAQYFMSYPNCRISRVDIAITSERDNGTRVHGLLPTAIHHLANNGYLDSRLKPDNAVLNSDNVETAYIGSRKARNRLFRAYDKGIDLGLDAMRIIRYELETRKRANVVLNAIAQGHDMGSIIRRYVDFPGVALWVEIMGAEPSVMPHIEIPETPEEKAANDRANRWHWIITSVAPALAKALAEDYLGAEIPAPIEENENLRLFGVRVQQLIEEIMENELQKK